MVCLMFSGRATVLTVLGISVIIAASIGLWLSTASGMLYRSLSVAGIDSKAILWVDSRNTFIVCDSFNTYLWDASNYWEIYLTLVNRGPAAAVVDGIYINGVPYYDWDCLTKYHIVYEDNGRLSVFPGKLVLEPGDKVVLRFLVPGAGFKAYSGHSGVFYSGSGSVFRHGDALTLSFASDGSTVAVVIILP